MRMVLAGVRKVKETFRKAPLMVRKGAVAVRKAPLMVRKGYIYSR